MVGFGLGKYTYIYSPPHPHFAVKFFCKPLLRYHAKRIECFNNDWYVCFVNLILMVGEGWGRVGW